MSEITFHDALLPYAEGWDDSIRKALGYRYYFLAGQAYYYKAYIFGDHAIAQARRLGFKPDNRSMLRRLLIPIIGLKGFEIIKRTIRLLQGYKPDVYRPN